MIYYRPDTKMASLTHVFTMSMLTLWLASILITADNDGDGALVTVEVEEENDTDVDILVNTVKSTKSTESFADQNSEPFIPTKEWKTVKPGQSIPAGLHVRLNLETGEREAKLMDGDDETGSDTQKDINIIGSTSKLQHLKKVFEEAIKEAESDPDGLKYWKQDGKEGILNTKKQSFSRDELKDALKKFKATSDDVKVKQEKQVFRTAEQLKQDLKDLELNMKTDLEVLDELIARYKNESVSSDEKMDILEELEWMVHQIDNAQYLVDSGGLEFIVKDLNNSDVRISEQAAFVVGSAVQSNPQVQVAAMTAGVMPHLIQKLTLSNDPKIQNRFLYALSALIRHFPYAQKKFVEGGGLQTLVSLLAKAADSKTKVKVVTLVTDIITERKLAEEQLKVKPSETLKQKVNQYKQVNLLAQLKEQRFCDMIPSLLSLQEHDTREKVLIAMETLFSDCTEMFRQSWMQLEALKEEYSSKAEEEATTNDPDTYFRDLLKRIDSILSQLEEHTMKIKHSEL